MTDQFPGMLRSRQADATLARLPTELVDRLTRPFAQFLRVEAASGALLLLSTVAAIVLSNSPWGTDFLNTWNTRVGFHMGSLEFARSLREWINDGLMTLFFFLVALELKRELILGELKNLRMAAFSIAAALGGMLVPAALYLILQSGHSGQTGWGTVMATDTAFVIGCLALVGSRVPQSLRVFMLSLAIVDDIGAILVVTIGYSSAYCLGRPSLRCPWYRHRDGDGAARRPKHSALLHDWHFDLARCRCVRDSRNDNRRNTRVADTGQPVGQRRAFICHLGSSRCLSK